MERRTARVLRQGRARRKAWIEKDAPFGAPSPRLREGPRKCPAKAGRDYGVPGAAKNTGDDACLEERGRGNTLSVMPGNDDRESAVGNGATPWPQT